MFSLSLLDARESRVIDFEAIARLGQVGIGVARFFRQRGGEFLRQVDHPEDFPDVLVQLGHGPDDPLLGEVVVFTPWHRSNGWLEVVFMEASEHDNTEHDDQK